MLNALYFEYDGVFSGNYGLQILDLQGSNTDTSTVATLDVKTVKAPKQKAFVYNGVSLSEPPTHQYQIISQYPLSDSVRREVLSWLLGRGEFKKLIIYQSDLSEYYYNCIFSNIDILFINGNCCGFELTATFDSMYAYAQPKKYTIQGSGSERMIKVINESDIADDYVYPKVKIRTEGDLSVTDAQGNYKSIKIFNSSDSTSRLGGCVTALGLVLFCALRGSVTAVALIAHRFCFENEEAEE